MKQYVIGIDYGTDSCRALIVDAMNGNQLALGVCYYPRWSKGLYCDPVNDMYRQHPLDYIDSMECAIKDVLLQIGDEETSFIRGISFDTTGSTPVFVNKQGVPLSLTSGFEDNPNAMFILWKDHTAIKEAEEINALAKEYHTDYTAYSGGIYSSEWVWSKILHVLRTDKKVKSEYYSWIEHCDWMGALLTGNTIPEKVMRSRCAAGHKAMWNDLWNGLPSQEFLTALDPALEGICERLFNETYTADVVAGNLTSDWAQRLGLPTGICVCVGVLDAHAGAVGAGITPNVLTRIMGTSTCDILTCTYEELSGKLIEGICGQVDGSVVPGYIGLEAGQSAFGDVYAWFKNLLAWSLHEFVPDSEFEKEIISRLSEKASMLPVGESSILALDWLHGRRTPVANQLLKGAITGLTLGSSAPMIFRALVEATAYGSRAIVERFVSDGIRIESILAIGGIAQKSPFVMQTLSDVLNKPIRVVNADQAVALGAAIFASVASGIHRSIEDAQKVIVPSSQTEYRPNICNAAIYERLYDNYITLGDFEEGKTI